MAQLSEPKLLRPEPLDGAVREKLPDVASHLLEECRMVLPGIQALFGFQLVVVFNQRFERALTAREQVLHFVALGLVALAVALVMTPAAYHRQTDPETISHRFVKIASAMLLWSMLPLALGISLDFYLIAQIILQSVFWSCLWAGALFLVFFGLWFVLPHLLPQPCAKRKGPHRREDTERDSKAQKA